MALETNGKLHKVFPTESKGTSGFQVREFVIETDGQYPQFVKFQVTQDKCDMLDNYQEGQQIKVAFDLRGREWQGKYFTNLNAWKIELAGGAAPSNPGSSSKEDFPSISQTPPPPSAEPAGSVQDSIPDDLPF